jgi:hypothetical protein
LDLKSLSVDKDVIAVSEKLDSSVDPDHTLRRPILANISVFHLPHWLKMRTISSLGVS